MIVKTVWNSTHDVAIITWPGHTQSRPLDAINYCLYEHFEQGNRAYLYEAWKDGHLLGMIVTGTLEFGPDEDVDAILSSLYTSVLEENSLMPQVGEWAPQDWSVV